MKRFLTTKLILQIFVLILLLPCLSISAEEKRIALVIGNGAYKSSPLANPVNDANDMADALGKCNFKVMKSINASRKEMRKAIRKFGEEINKGAVGLFYYAGHGIQVDGENYLVPVGSEVYTEAEVEDECLKVSSVLRQMETAGNRLNIIILDACRDNPFGRSFRSSNMGLAKMDAPTGSILAYATAPGSVAADGTSGNGLYTSKLLTHMNTPGLKIEEVFKKVRIDVVNASGNRQTPWESSSLMGDFFFNTKRGIAVEKRPSGELEKPLEKRTEYASVSPEVSEPRVVTHDGRFIKYETGVVYDESTGLEWYVGPDEDTNYDDAKSWVKSLNTEEPTGGYWRMPTIKELETLYQKGMGTHNRTPLLKSTGWIVWSGETLDSSFAWGFHYFGQAYRGKYSADGYIRAFAVRSKNMRVGTQKNRLNTDDTPKHVSIDKNKVQRGWIGIGTQDLSEDIAKFYGMKEREGVLVTEAYSGDPAYNAGIKRGDIILSVNGKKIKDTKVLVSTIAGLKVGETAIIEVLRKGGKKTFKVKVANRPEMLE